MKKAFLIGSFDPITNGHIEIIKRTYEIFSNVSILILENRNKKYMFNLEDRVKMIEIALLDLNIKANVYNDNILLVEACKKYNVDVVVRGIRNTADYIYEEVQNRVNLSLDDSVNFVYLFSSNKYSHISSSVVRELLSYNKSVKDYLPEKIEKYIGGLNGKK